MIENDYPSLGEMTFYEVPLDAETKLLGPTAIIEALERNPTFATLRTLLRNPRVGDNILYRIGEHDVYFIPVYTAGAGGVVTQLGTVAAIGAAFTGEYYIGFGTTAEEAFTEFLLELSGIEVAEDREEDGIPLLSSEARREEILKIFEDARLLVAEPDEIPSLFKFKEDTTRYISQGEFDEAKQLVEAFIEEWAVSYGLSRVYTWSNESGLNLGFVVQFDGVAELHYITIEIE